MIRWRKAFMAVALLAASFAGGACYQWAFGQRTAEAQGEVPQELRAHSVAIVDQAGHVRARLGTSENGSGALVITDEAGTLRMTVGESAAGDVGVQLFDGTGHWRCGFSHGEAGALINLTSQNDMVLLSLGVQADGEAGGISLINAHGTQVFGLGTSLGGTGISLMDLAGATRVNAGVGDDGNASFRVIDPNGVPRASMAVEPGGSGSIAVLDEGGQDIWRMR